MEEYFQNAKLHCWNCKHEWEQKSCPTQCPKCNHLFLTWMNHPLTIAQEKEPNFFEKVKIIDKALENE